MSLQHERRQRQREESPPSSEQRATRDYVLTFAEWCEINAISQPTGRRILASGNGPPVLQLSLRRLGIRMSDNLAWQQSRVRPSA
jgi:predicted DNA-binding transcriptional regulator AlpA